MQQGYLDLYANLRNYIWDIDIVDSIADLEERVYRAFPSVDSVQSSFDKIVKGCKSIKDDKELMSSIKGMQHAIDESDSIYVKLWTPRSV